VRELITRLSLILSYDATSFWSIHDIGVWISEIMQSSHMHWILKLPDIRIEMKSQRSHFRFEVIDHLNLVDLHRVLEKAHASATERENWTELLSFANDRFHLFLDIFEFGFFESNITEVDIIVPTGIDIRSDCKLAVSTHDHASGLCHDVGERVTASRERHRRNS
jgi:hypothetical protein